MHLLLTRPAGDNELLARRLRAAGHRVSIAPMLDIRSLGSAPLDDSAAAGLVLGSANAVRHGAARLTRRDLPVWCVGPATADAARTAGFHDIRTGGGDGTELARLIVTQANPADGPLLYPCGKERRPEPERGLARAGFRIIAVPVYEACEVATLPGAVAEALARGDIEVVLLYSPRTARHFCALVAADVRARLGFAVLSPAVARELGPDRRRAVTAGAPDEESLLATLAAAKGADFGGEQARRA